MEPWHNKTFILSKHKVQISWSQKNIWMSFKLKEMGVGEVSPHCSNAPNHVTQQKITQQSEMQWYQESGGCMEASVVGIPGTLPSMDDYM